MRGFATVRNLGNFEDAVAVRGNRGNRFFRVTYRSALGNRTALVTSGRHRSAALSGATAPDWLRADVRPNRRALTRQVRGRAVVQRRNFAIVFRASSVLDPAQSDQARIRVQVR